MLLLKEVFYFLGNIVHKEDHSRSVIEECFYAWFKKKKKKGKKLSHNLFGLSLRQALMPSLDFVLHSDILLHDLCSLDKVSL